MEQANDVLYFGAKNAYFVTFQIENNLKFSTDQMKYVINVKQTKIIEIRIICKGYGRHERGRILNDVFPYTKVFTICSLKTCKKKKKKEKRNSNTWLNPNVRTSYIFHMWQFKCCLKAQRLH